MILNIKDLKVQFMMPHGIVNAVDGVSFGIEKGETFGIVGESGSGKTMTALSILKLIPPSAKITGGQILFNGTDLLKADDKTLRDIRGSKIAMVFQEPASSLNPVFTIGEQIVEAVSHHKMLKTKKEAKGLTLEYLNRVRIPNPAKILHDYPHQLSGGTRQRAMIAMALVNSPELLILDEPTTALDVTIQAQILDLLEEVGRKEGLSTLFISHDFGIIAKMCNRVAVMHKGRIVEDGMTKNILSTPRDPYTISLLESARAIE